MTMFGNAIGLSPANLGMRLFKPSAAQALWGDPNNEGLPVVGAYRAIATVGSPWPLAPANYAETLQDWSGTSPPLVEGAGAVPWAANTGWQFVAAATQYFNTGLIPANDQSWTMLIQYTGAVGVNLWICGVLNGGGRIFGLQPLRNGTHVGYFNGGFIQVIPQLANGNTAVVGNQAYRNGVLDGGPIGGWTGASAQPVYIGCLNNAGAPGLYITANIRALAFYDGTLTAPQVLAVATAMAAL
jgi:hypothetical protein